MKLKYAVIDPLQLLSWHLSRIYQHRGFISLLGRKHIDFEALQM